MNLRKVTHVLAATCLTTLFFLSGCEQQGSNATVDDGSANSEVNKEALVPGEGTFNPYDQEKKK